MKKAILLVRISSESQELDEQTNDLMDYAIKEGYLKKNLVIIEDIESAINLVEKERKGLNQLKNHIKNDSSIDAVFLWELSRLARTMSVGISVRDFLIINKIQLFCKSPNFRLLEDDKTPSDNGLMSFTIFLQMAESEMKNKKARFHRSKIRNAKTGKYSGGFIKYGYKVNDLGYYEIKEKEADLIRYIFNEYAKGRSIMKLTKELLDRGKINTQNFVNGILNSEAYTGISNKYGMNRVYPQIISNELYQKCRQIAKENNKKLDKTPEVYFCKKLIKCNECGTNYIGMKSSLIYLCYGRYGKEAKLNPANACKNSPVININLLDSLVWDIAKEDEVFNIKDNSKKDINRIKEKIEINNEKINSSEIKIQNIEKKRKRNNNMYFKAQISEKKYETNAAIIDKEVKELNNLIVKSRNDNEQLEIKIKNETKKVELIDLFNDKAEYIESITDDSERYEIVQNHIKEINILEDEPNKTKIILIHLHNGKSQRYRVHIKAKPPQVEYDSTFIYDGKLPSIWINYPLKIEKRFVRYKKI